MKAMPRTINAAGDDHQDLADSQKANRGHKAHHDGQVGRLEKNVGVLYPEKQAQYKKDDRNASHAELRDCC
jgi:hypothetical protein